jgi:hypothetical protein
MIIPTAKQGVANRSGDHPELRWRWSVASIAPGVRTSICYMCCARRMEYPKLKCAARKQRRALAASVVLIEDKASGIQLIQELVAEGLHAVTRSPAAHRFRSNRGRCPRCEHAYRNERRRDDPRYANG